MESWKLLYMLSVITAALKRLSKGTLKSTVKIKLSKFMSIYKRLRFLYDNQNVFNWIGPSTRWTLVLFMPSSSFYLASFWLYSNCGPNWWRNDRLKSLRENSTKNWLNWFKLVSKHRFKLVLKHWFKLDFNLNEEWFLNIGLNWSYNFTKNCPNWFSKTF